METQFVDSLEYVSQMIERHDFHTRSLLEVTGFSQHGVATGSGLNDYDYQNMSTLSMGMKHLNQLVTSHKVPIPPEIMEHFKHIKCHCMMGLFPEIGRAWLTIDSDIYIWTYEDERDVAYFDGLNHLIVSVGLVVPKPGLFVNDVKYLLVLTTPVEIIVLGVTFGDSTKTVCSPNKSSMQNCTTTPYEEMQLMTKPIFVVNTDNVSMTLIEGTTDGRIMMGGRDGCLYELQYQAESNWFGKRYHKVNHSQSLISYVVPGFLKAFSEQDTVSKMAIDNSRQLLYILFQKGAIEAWQLAENGRCNRFARISAKQITQLAGRILKTVDTNIFQNVTAICALESDEHPRMNLIAVTQSGVRLYFSVTPFQIQNPLMNHPMPQPDASGQCDDLYLYHVRLPPGYTPSTTVGKPRQVHSAFHHQGTMLMVSAPQQEQDLLWSLSMEPFPTSAYFTESSTLVQLDGQVWAMAKMKDNKAQNTTISTLRQTQQPSKIALLTNQGVHIVSLLKPVDLLQQLLLACNGPHHDAVKAYFQVQRESEACATSLILACWEQARGSEMASWATQAFLIYGGEPTLLANNPNNNNLSAIGGFGGVHSIQQQQSAAHFPFNASGFDLNGPPTASTPYRAAAAVQQSLFQQTTPGAGVYGSQGSPSSMMANNNSMNMSLTAIMDHNVTASAKHTGLYLYVQRLLKPIWRKPCVHVKENGAQLTSTITLQDCSQILEELYAIKQFLAVNSVTAASTNTTGSSHHQQQSQQQSFQVQGGGGSGSFASHVQQPQTSNAGNQFQAGGGRTNSAEDARMAEKRSLDALTKFIRHACEVLALWRIVCEHQFHVLAGQLSLEQRQALASCYFRDLITSRTDICCQLIVTLINFYLNDNASVGSISAKLRDVCPTLYSHEDSVSHKATEILILSKAITDPEQKNERLCTALQLCKTAAPNLPLSNICQQFTSLGFHQGVVDLCETCASKMDPTGAGVHFYKSGEPSEDREGFLAYSSRVECYKEVKLMLEQVYQTNRTAVAASEGTVGGGAMNGERAERANRDISTIVSLALQSRDYLLHIAVYEWLLSHQMLGELLGIAEPSLGQFLNNSVNKCPENQQLADLLWKYHERNGQHSQAAKILDRLATMETDRIGLTQRIEYLARAVMCMRSDTVGYSVHNGMLLKDLEDKLLIAQVQKFTHDSLAALNRAGQEQPQVVEACRALNASLYTMTDLYMKFAERFELWECKLKILNSSHHNDPLLIEMVWAKILEQEEAHGGSPYEKMCRLLTKVEALGREYNHPGHCFPVSYLVRELELHCCRFRLEENSPVPEALLRKMKLDADTVLDIYSRMISMNERVWYSAGNEWHLVQATISALTILATQPPTLLVPVHNRRRVIAKAQELLSACLNLLYTKPDTQHLIEALRELQAKLQRI